MELRSHRATNNRKTVPNRRVIQPVRIRRCRREGVASEPADRRASRRAGRISRRISRRAGRISRRAGPVARTDCLPPASSAVCVRTCGHAAAAGPTAAGPTATAGRQVDGCVGGPSCRRCSGRRCVCVCTRARGVRASLSPSQAAHRARRGWTGRPAGRPCVVRAGHACRQKAARRCSPPPPAVRPASRPARPGRGNGF